MKNSEMFWDKLSKNYDKSITVSDVQKYQSYNYLIKYLGHESRVLDFGCATGTLALSLKDKAAEIHGIDLSSKMIEMAEKNKKNIQADNVTFFHKDIFDKSLKEGSYDMVLAFNVLHLIKNAADIVKRINQLLKPGAYFVTLTPCIGQKKIYNLLLFLITKTGLVPHINRFKTGQFKKMIADNDFEIIEDQSLDKNPLEHFILAKRKI